MKREFKLIRQFIRFVNLANLPVPADSMGFITHTKEQSPTTLARFSHETTYGYEYDYTHVVFAIAQHSGVPTRLLDFSYNPFVAAYFAADITGLVEKHGFSQYSLLMDFIETLKKHQEPAEVALSSLLTKQRKLRNILPKTMAVWAIRVDHLPRTSLRLLDHPHTEILNLKSQSGAFICDIQPIGPSSKPGELFCDALVKLIEDGDIYKLTLPYSEWAHLFALLEKKRIAQMYLKPTYEQVAERVLASVAKTPS